jgi:hypothetical protein
MEEFTPHGFCLAWQPVLLWVTVIAHAGIAWAYFGISFLLLMAVMYRMVIIAHWLVIMFSAFIFACGVGHFLEIVTLWYPIFWISAIEDLITSLISLATFLLLPIGIAGAGRRYLPRRPGHDASANRSDGEVSPHPGTVSTEGAAPLLSSPTNAADADRKPPGSEESG